jgi:hypothetical protein
MAKKKATGRVKATRPKARSATEKNAEPLTAAQRLAINTAIDRRIRRAELIEKESRFIGRKSLSMLAALFPRVQPILHQRVRAFERVNGRLPDAAMRRALLRLTIDAFVYGFRLAAGDSIQGKRTAAGAGAAATAANAEERKRRIIAAYDATDPSLPETQRYAAVKGATGIRSVTTILRALRSR